MTTSYDIEGCDVCGEDRRYCGLPAGMDERLLWQCAVSL